MPLFTAQPGFDFTEGLPPGRNFGLMCNAKKTDESHAGCVRGDDKRMRSPLPARNLTN